MLSWLQFWEDIWGPLRLFQYISVRALGAGITALMIGFWIGPTLISSLKKLVPGKPLEIKMKLVNWLIYILKRVIRLPWGGLIFISVLLSVLLWAEPNVYVCTALITYALLTIVGFADDYLKVSKKNSKGLPGRYKLVGQLFATIAALFFLLGPLSASLNGVGKDVLGSAEKMREFWMPFISYPDTASIPVLSLGGIFLLYLLTLTGTSNAINLTDGLDGLAIGCTVTVALTYAIMAYASGNYLIADYLKVSWVPGTGELAIVCIALLGGSLAFLWYNAHPAEVFMGDTGSLAIGGLIGVIALMIHQPLTLIIVGGIFVMEASSVIIQVASFKMRGKRIFLMSPIHHHFELKGWKETKVVIRFWILSLLFALLGLATLKLR